MCARQVQLSKVAEGYLHKTHRPLNCLVFILPFLVAYEVGSIFIGDRLLAPRYLAAALGVSPPPHLPLALALAAAGWADRLAAPLDLRLPLTRRRLAFFSHQSAFSLEAAGRDYGYAPRVALAEGLAAVMSWYRQQGLLGGG